MASSSDECLVCIRPDMCPFTNGERPALCTKRIRDEGGKTRLPVSSLIRWADTRKLVSAVVVGFDADGGFHMASTTATDAGIRSLIEKAAERIEQ